MRLVESLRFGGEQASTLRTWSCTTAASPRVQTCEPETRLVVTFVRARLRLSNRLLQGVNYVCSCMFTLLTASAVSFTLLLVEGHIC